MGIAVVNSFLLHKELCNVKSEHAMTHKAFSETLILEISEFAHGQVAAAPPHIYTYNYNYFL